MDELLIDKNSNSNCNSINSNANSINLTQIKPKTDAQNKHNQNINVYNNKTIEIRKYVKNVPIIIVNGMTQRKSRLYLVEQCL